MCIDRWTDMTELIVTFHNPVNVSKNAIFTYLKITTYKLHFLTIQSIRKWYATTVIHFSV